ncbi:MAG: radical SAM protein [Treponema sp.]|jgi:sulfatase maturation enzyme AslB (radical SAM superfamily)|nr:radical SAM protein [Treponema sp.]
MEQAELHFTPNLCVTRSCNLDCVYCYQKHTGERMPFETARNAVDWIFAHVPDYADGVEIGFIGGEPLLEFQLMRQVFEYACDMKPAVPHIFFATTNGTLLTDEMKAWFAERKECFWLGLSLDGTKETHDRNRGNSFDKIDTGFFLRNWPEQDIKMTLSEFSLGRLAEDVKYIHSLGFKKIGGVNLAEGSFDWDRDEYIRRIIPQLAELAEFYVENEHLAPDQMFGKKLDVCEGTMERRKWCGIGTGTPFFDVDGKRYPCSFITPMTFPQNELHDILRTDFADDGNFIDDDCFNNCYIYPVCPCCSGADYMVNKTFKKRNKSKCRIQKLITLFIADMQAKLIQKNPKRYDDTTLYYTIEAIKKIRGLYLDEFKEFI